MSDKKEITADEIADFHVENYFSLNPAQKDNENFRKELHRRHKALAEHELKLRLAYERTEKTHKDVLDSLQNYFLTKSDFPTVARALANCVIDMKRMVDPQFFCCHGESPHEEIKEQE